MKTEIFDKDVSDAAEILKKGGLVAVPTETVYGLAGNGLDENTVKNIYEVKGRPAVKPLSLMISGTEAMGLYCDKIPPQANVLARRFWPGPLTIVLKSRDIVPALVRAGGETVGLRCPDHPMTLELLKLSGIPFAAPSANPSGESSPKTAQKVFEYFDSKIEGIVDGGECGIGLESTIIDMSRTPYRVLRQGALDADDIADALVKNMRIIGITGGTGCGKTTALNIFSQLGGLVIDCDAVYHELMKNCTEMREELKERFPTAFVDGKIERKKLGKIAFADENALKELNNITHAYVSREVIRLLREYAMNGGELAFIDAIELFSGRLAKLYTATIAVIADRDIRIKRIIQRDDISYEYALSRINAQKSDSYFRERCTYILENNGSEDELKSKCNKLFEEIL